MDITTTGAKTGRPRRIEIWFTRCTVAGISPAFRPGATGTLTCTRTRVSSSTSSTGRTQTWPRPRSPLRTRRRGGGSSSTWSTTSISRTARPEYASRNGSRSAWRAARSSRSSSTTWHRTARERDPDRQRRPRLPYRPGAGGAAADAIGRGLGRTILRRDILPTVNLIQGDLEGHAHPFPMPSQASGGARSSNNTRTGARSQKQERAGKRWICRQARARCRRRFDRLESNPVRKEARRGARESNRPRRSMLENAVNKGGSR